MSYKDKVTQYKRNGRSSYDWGRVVTWFRNRLLNAGSVVSPRTVFLSLLGILLGGALACQVIWQHVRYTRTRVQINNLERQSHELDMKIHRTELAVSRLERLDRVQRIAVNQLGMEPLDETPVMEMSQAQWVQSSREGDEPMVP